MHVAVDVILAYPLAQRAHHRKNRSEFSTDFHRLQNNVVVIAARFATSSEKLRDCWSLTISKVVDIWIVCAIGGI